MVKQTDEEFIAEIAALAEKATGLPVLPWEARNGDVYFDGERVAKDCWTADAAFIAESRTAIPRLLAIIARLEKAERERDDALARVELQRKALQRIEVKQPDGDGFVWATFTTPHRQIGSFNLGAADKFATKVALEFERLRCAALEAKE